MASDRYDRQNRIPGWNQNRLFQSYIAIVGAGPIAQAVTLCIAGLGMGEVRIFDNKKVPEVYDPSLFQLRNSPAGYPRVYALEKMLKDFNPSINFRGIKWDFNRQYFADAILGKPQVIVDCTNDPFEEYVLYCYAQVNKIPIINASASKHKYEVSVLQPDPDFNVPADFYFDKESRERLSKQIPERYLQTGFDGENESGFPALMAGGVVTDQIRKFLMPLSEADRPLKGIFRYNALSRERFQVELDGMNPIGNIDNAFSDLEFPEGLTIYIVGAGSIGNAAGLGLAVGAPKGTQIVIFDKDEVEEINLNRQVLFDPDDVGKFKVKALAEKMMEINPDLKVRAVPEFFELKNYRVKPNIILVCTDSFKSRKITNDYAKLRGVPLISGGTNFESFNVITYVPGHTRCLCELSVDENAAAEEERERHSCVRVPEPSVIIPNWEAGMEMVMQIPHALNPEKYDPISGRISGSSTSPNLMSVARRPKCDCDKDVQK